MRLHLLLITHIHPFALSSSRWLTKPLSISISIYLYLILSQFYQVHCFYFCTVLFDLSTLLYLSLFSSLHALCIHIFFLYIFILSFIFVSYHSVVSDYSVVSYQSFIFVYRSFYCIILSKSNIQIYVSF